MRNLDDVLVGAVDPRSPVAEAYRTLRTNVQFASLDRPLRSLLVTSAGPEEDKSAVAANLAAAFAQAGSRVVLVDGDLRWPRQHAIFGLANDRGLASLAADRGEGAWPLLETGIPNLRLLPAGAAPASPGDLLGSPRLQAIIEGLCETADLLVFDSPPVLAVTDAALLARRVDGVLLVFHANRTKRDQAAKARALLAKVNANVLGAVLTNAKLDEGLRTYYATGGKWSQQKKK